jgi:hypothetical protein
MTLAAKPEWRSAAHAGNARGIEAGCCRQGDVAGSISGNPLSGVAQRLRFMRPASSFCDLLGWPCAHTVAGLQKPPKSERSRPGRPGVSQYDRALVFRIGSSPRRPDGRGFLSLQPSNAEAT